MPTPPEREAQVLSRLNTVVGKLEEAAKTLEGGPNAGAFLQALNMYKSLHYSIIFWDIFIVILDKNEYYKL